MEVANPEKQVKAMTFNLRGATRGFDGVNTWSNREGMVVSLIEKHTPHFLGAQEVNFGNLATYAERLRERGGSKYYGELLGPDMDYGWFNPIFWRTEHFELDTAGGFFLHPNQIPNTVAKEWGAANIRCANWAVFRERDSQDKVCIINTHLDHISEQARYEGARLIVQTLQGLEDIPTILTGDLNMGRYVPEDAKAIAPYTDKTLQIFEEAGFADVYALLHADGEGSNTFHGFLGDNFDPAKDYALWRLDHILVRGMSPDACEIDRYAQPPVYPSDHYPVIATLSKS